MSAAVILAPVSHSHATFNMPAPAVSCDGQVLAEARVCEVVREGQFDERAATIELPSALAARVLASSEVAITQPLPMADGAVEHAVLCVGRAVQIEEQSEGRVLLAIRDAWSRVLDGVVQTLTDHAGVLAVGRHANRSAERGLVRGRSVFVPANVGEPWSLQDALEYLFALQGFDVSCLCLPKALRDAPIVRRVELHGSWRQVLTAVIRPYALRFERSVTANAVHCVDAAGASRIPLAWPREGSSAADVLHVRPLRGAALAARHDMATAPPREVETTMLLAPMWDAALMGEDEDTYSTSTSSHFPTYRNVYRLWATNFDGRFRNADGPRPASEVDWPTLFDDQPVDAANVRLGACLVLDDNGQPLDAIVEYSTNGGLTWAVYPGRVVSRLREGAIYLDDDVLPASYFAAAEVGGVLVRLTTTLTHSHRQRVEQWRGDVLRHPAVATELHTDCFEWRQVLPSSRHADELQAGELRADEADDRGAMSYWLRSAAVEARPASGSIWELQLSRPWPLLRPGDVLLNAGGAGLTLEGLAQAADYGGAVVESVRVVWHRGGGRAVMSPSTLVRCVV